MRENTEQKNSEYRHFLPFFSYSFVGVMKSSGVFGALSNICDALHNLVPFVQFKKREKHPWRSFTFSKIAG